MEVAETVVEDDELGLVGFDGFETGGQHGNGSIQFQELLVSLSESLGDSRHVSIGEKGRVGMKEEGRAKEEGGE